MDLPYKIKPVLHLRKKAIFIFISLWILAIIYAATIDGKFDLGMFIFQFIVMCMVMYICFFGVKRTIVLKSDKLIYKLLLKNGKINYKNIIMINVLKKEKDNYNSYSLIVTEKNKKYKYQISDIQNYWQTDIELLIDAISAKNQRIYLISDKLKVDLNEVWLNSVNCK